MKIKMTLAALVHPGLSGCVSRGIDPVAMGVDISRSYDAPFDMVWTAIIGSIADGNLSVTTLENASGLIAINGITYSSNDALEGYRGSVMGVPDQAIARSAKSNIFATHLTDGKTNVRVNTSFSMEIRTGNGSHVFPYQDQWKQAHSNGNVERTVLNEIQYRIGAQHSASEIGRSVSVFVPGRRSTAFTKIRT